MRLQLTAIAYSCLLLSACSSDPHAMVQKGLPQVRKVQSDRSTLERQPLVLDVNQEELRQMAVTTAVAAVKVVPDVIKMGGQVEPDQSMTTPVISLMSGRLQGVEVSLGDAVKTGTALCSIRSDEVAQLEADMLKAVLDYDADIERSQVSIQLYRKVYERKKTLLSEGVAAQAEVEMAKNDLDKELATLESLNDKRTAAITTSRERLRHFGVPVKDIEQILNSKTIDNSFEIYSPRSGVITTRNVDVGEFIDNVHELFVVSDLSVVWVVAQVFEQDVGQIERGDQVTLRVDAYPKQVFTGRVDYVASDINPETRTMAARITVQNPKLLLKPKMFARMDVQVGTKKILAVPADAVQQTGESRVVYVVTADGKYIEKQVEIGDEEGGLVDVRKGLVPGDRVVVHGSLQMQGIALQQSSQ